VIQVVTVLLTLLAAPAAAQVRSSMRPIGRVSMYVQTLRLMPDDGPDVQSSEFITAIQVSPPDADADHVEYAFDMRHRNSSRRPGRLSLYDGYLGALLAGGRVRARLGRMWLPDLGGLGSVAGGLFEYRRPGTAREGSRLRVGVFAGLEPEIYGIGNAEQVRKAGVYATIDAPGGRRHTAGLVRIRHAGLTERSVLSVSNFVPMPSHLFVYQTAEYDLVGPAGQPGGGLSYMMINAHGLLTDRVELQGLYHRGRSVDARTITEDVLNGRPLRPGALDGLLYESSGGRATVRLTEIVRVNAGYARDRNNRDSAATGRITVGGSVSNVLRTGIDATVSESWISRPTGQYQSRYISAGRRVGSATYVSADYSTSLSIARFTRSDGITIETRPRTRQLSTSAVVTLNRNLSLVTMLDYTRDDVQTDVRVHSGLTIRLR
jgi:hypothetical protein